jgi:hypothetical protein
MKQQDARPARILVAGVENVHPQAVDAVDETLADAGGKRCIVEGRHCRHDRTGIPICRGMATSAI